MCLHLLRRHLFPVEAHFDWSLAVVWAWPEDRLKPLLPPGLELDTYEGHGFVALAVVKTRQLRPAGFPAWTGNDFVLTGYRLFTRYTTRQGRRLRGLRILGGGSDSHRMTALGRWLTHYGYRHMTVRQVRTDGHLEVSACGGHRLHLIARLDLPASDDLLPDNSVFPDLRTARRFAGPMPFTFDYEKETHSMIRVEGVRSQWQPQPVRVEVRENSFFESDAFCKFGPGRMANAFMVRDVPYHWKRGVVEKLA